MTLLLMRRSGTHSQAREFSLLPNEVIIAITFINKLTTVGDSLRFLFHGLLETTAFEI